MKTISSQLIHILLLGYLLFGAIDTARACTSSSTTPQLTVQNAEVILRAKAVKTVENQKVKLIVTEVLKGTNVPTTLLIAGFLSKEDGFNRNTVPYASAYSHSNGLCHSKNYKEDGEYLLLLIERDGELTPYWGSSFAPSHEQLRPADDKWLNWVKGFLKWLETATEVEKIKIRFEHLKKLQFNTDAELIWEYRFVDSSQKKLQRMAKHLESLGYTFVKISKAEIKEDLGDFELQVEKIEKHSPSTLAQRNEQLRVLAINFSIRKYNQGGMRRVK